jgi:hypothetical protein
MVSPIKKLAHYKCGLLIAPAYRRQGMRDLEHSGIAGLGLHNFFLPLFHILRHISSIDDERSLLHNP